MSSYKHDYYISQPTMLLLIYLTIPLLILYWLTTKNHSHWKSKNVPSLRPLPLIGNMRDGVLMRLSFGEVFEAFYHQTKSAILGFYMFTQPCLLIKDPQIIKRILVSDFNHFYDRNVLNNKRDDPIGTHILFFLKNPDWKDVRSKISPIYSSSKIKAMSRLMEEAAKQMIEYLTEECKRHDVVDMKDVNMKYTVDVITSTAFGADANSFKDENAPFYNIAKRMLNWDNFIISFRIRCYLLAHSIVKIFRMRMLDPVSIAFLEKSFWTILNQRAASKTKRNDLIDVLLQMQNDEKNFLKGDVLVSQAVVFFGAGFETSSSTIGFALHELARHPKIQSKLRDEINKVSKQHEGINYDSVLEMKYLDMCVKETLRKYPAVSVLDRRSNCKYTIPETGTVLEKGTPVYIPNMALHYDPQYFPDPETFDPERFSPQNKHLIQSFTYLPFGEGPRNCIGARFGNVTVRIGLANIIQNFVLEAGPDSPTKIKFNPNCFVLVPLHAIKLKVKKV